MEVDSLSISLDDREGGGIPQRVCFCANGNFHQREGYFVLKFSSSRFFFSLLMLCLADVVNKASHFGCPPS